MILRPLIWLLAALCLAGCADLLKKKETEKKKQEATKMADKSSDVSFQSFLGRLRTAVKNRDVQMLASMMTPNFGYGINPDREGEGVFKFWEENDLWKELELVLREKFVPMEGFMVAPRQFAE